MPRTRQRWLIDIERVLTLLLIAATCWLAMESRWLASDWRKTSREQIGVQTWLALEARWDSNDMKAGRRELASKLSAEFKHGDISDQVMEFFESVGSAYNLGLINKDLAISSFGYALRYWDAAEKYVQDERRRQGGDPSYYDQWEEFAKVLRKREQPITEEKLKNFLADESSKN